MTRMLIGTFFLSVAVGVLAWAVWSRLVGNGRHRRPGRPADAPYEPDDLFGVEAGQADEDDEDGAHYADADRADYDHCPTEGRRTPHFLHTGGARTCCSCKTTTAGDS
ncbi:hypothetical protein G6541_13330 [Streptomyces albidoflavus]|nr:hypothetical protein [Streptomyces albidoflavus]